jgi:hypothetical protein
VVLADEGGSAGCVERSGKEDHLGKEADGAELGRQGGEDVRVRNVASDEETKSANVGDESQVGAEKRSWSADAGGAVDWSRTYAAVESQ